MDNNCQKGSNTNSSSAKQMWILNWTFVVTGCSALPPLLLLIAPRQNLIVHSIVRGWGAEVSDGKLVVQLSSAQNIFLCKIAEGSRWGKLNDQRKETH